MTAPTLADCSCAGKKRGFSRIVDLLASELCLLATKSSRCAGTAMVCSAATASLSRTCNVSVER